MENLFKIISTMTTKIYEQINFNSDFHYVTQLRHTLIKAATKKHFCSCQLLALLEQNAAGCLVDLV